MLRFRLLACRFAVCAVLIAGASPRQAEAQEASAKEASSKARLEVMTEAAGGFKISQRGSGESPKFGDKPLLRYSDPTREVEALGLLDATVWRLGAEGRPAGLLTIEIYNDAGDRAVLSYEFAALANEQLSLTHSARKDLAWQTPAEAFALNPLADAPPPADTSTARLGQMRRLARRFTVNEIFNDLSIECRLLAQPIDRYSSKDEGIVDGALFVFANGTNPEIGLLLECGEASWSYGLVRLASAEANVQLDGKEVAKFKAGDFRSTRQGDYLAHVHGIELKK